MNKWDGHKRHFSLTDKSNFSYTAPRGYPSPEGQLWYEPVRGILLFLSFETGDPPKGWGAQAERGQFRISCFEFATLLLGRRGSWRLQNTFTP